MPARFNCANETLEQSCAFLVRWMVDAIKDRNFTKFNRINAFKAAYIITKHSGIRPAPVMGVDAAVFAKEMLGDMGMELITAKLVSSFYNGDLG